MITDVHLDKGKEELVKDIFGQLIVLCRKKGVERVICAGDVFTSRSGQPLECLSAWSSILEDLQENGISLYVIPGNHDKTNADDERSYLDVYGNWGQVLIRNHFTIKCRGGVDITMIPYFGTERWLSELSEVDINKGTKQVLVTHMAFDGVKNNDGTTVSDGVPPSAVKGFDAVFCGHYHNASAVGKNIHYIGSAYQNDYGENITDKGFTVLYDDLATEFVPSVFPKYIKKTIKASDRETLTNLLDKYGNPEIDHIRFEFVGTKAELEQINTTEIKNRFGIDCKFKSDEETEAVDVAEEEAVLNYDKSTITKDFYAFCAKNKIKGAHLKYGIRLIKML